MSEIPPGLLEREVVRVGDSPELPGPGALAEMRHEGAPRLWGEAHDRCLYARLPYSLRVFSPLHGCECGDALQLLDIVFGLEDPHPLGPFAPTTVKARSTASGA